MCDRSTRDYYRYPLVEAYRESHEDTVDRELIVNYLETSLNGTRFVPLGGPAGSGSLIAYYFRTQNNLPESLFASPSEIADLDFDHLAQIQLLVVLDDICGSGGTARHFALDELHPLGRRFLEAGHPEPTTVYLALCGTSDGLDVARDSGYERAEAAVFVDRTYRVCDAESRYFGVGRNRHDDAIALEEGALVLRGYGERLFPAHPLGFRDGQLLLGFTHNIPNNTLPIMWSTAGDPKWLPPFERHAKNPNVANAAARLPT